MAYKIIINKTGLKAGEIVFESLDSNSCGVVQEITQSHTILSNETINHGDENPVYDSVRILE